MDPYSLVYDLRRIDDLLCENPDHPAVLELARIATEHANLLTENASHLRHRRNESWSYRDIPTTEGPEPAREYYRVTGSRKLREVVTMHSRRHIEDKVRPLTRWWRGEPQTGQGKAKARRRGEYGRGVTLRRAA